MNLLYSIRCDKRIYFWFRFVQRSRGFGRHNASRYLVLWGGRSVGPHWKFLSLYPIRRLRFPKPNLLEAFQRMDTLAKRVFNQEKVSLWKEKVNFKKPGSKRFEPHQDSQAGWTESTGSPGPFLNIHLAIDPCTKVIWRRFPVIGQTWSALFLTKFLKP